MMCRKKLLTALCIVASVSFQLDAQILQRSSMMKNANPDVALNIRDFIVNGAVLVSTGVVSSADNYKSTAFIAIEPLSLVECTLPYSSGAGVVYYNVEKKHLSGYCAVNGGDYSKIVPEEARYVRFSCRTDYDYDPDVRIFNSKEVNARELIHNMWGSVDMTIGLAEQLTPDYRPVFSYDDFDGESFFRIPVHVRTIHGTIIVVSEIRRKPDEKAYGVSIARSENEAKSFDKIIIDGSYPCLLYDKVSDVLYIFEGLSYRKSLDDGRTWSEPIKSVSMPRSWQIVHASSNNGIQLTNGVLAIPVIFQNSDDKYQVTENRSAILFSSDYGRSWKFTELTPTDIISNEFCIAEYKTNQIMINARGGTELSWSKNNPGRRVFVPSSDIDSNRFKWTVNGWKLHESDCTITEPVCNASFISCHNLGYEFGLFCNPQSRDSERKNLLLQVTSDYTHWSKIGLLTPQERTVYGYCSLDYTDGILSFVYEDKECGILYADLSEFMDDIMQKVAINKILYQ